MELAVLSSGFFFMGPKNGIDYGEPSASLNYWMTLLWKSTLSELGVP